MTKLYNILDLNYDDVIGRMASGDLSKGGFPLFPYNGVRECYKHLGDGQFEYYLMTNYEEFANVVACNVEYTRFSSGIEITNIVESPATPNIFWRVLFRDMVHQHYNVILPLSQFDIKFLSKIPIFQTNEVRVSIIKFNGVKFIRVLDDIISIIKDRADELDNYKLLLSTNFLEHEII